MTEALPAGMLFQMIILHAARLDINCKKSQNVQKPFREMSCI